MSRNGQKVHQRSAVRNDDIRQVIYADGCGPSRGIGMGGWGAVILLDCEVQREMHGRDDRTTVNRMELTGVIRGLEVTSDPGIVLVCSDSRYVVNGFNKGNVNRWLRNGWKTLRGTPVKNRDLWERLLTLARERETRFRWVPSGSHPMNVAADELSRRWKTTHKTTREAA